MNKQKNKIAIISNSLGLGGAEKFASLLSYILSDLGYEIHNIIIDDVVKYKVSGKLINLGINYKNDFSIIRKFKKGIIINNYLKNNNISIVIDNRSRPILIREFFTKYIYSNCKTIYLVHLSKLDIYLSKPIFLSRIIYQSASKIVCVSKSIEEDIIRNYKLKNTETIYNPQPIDSIDLFNMEKLPEKYFIYFGRLDENQKNLCFMLESFFISKVYENDFHLILIGDGESESLLRNKIEELKLAKFVTIKPFSTNVLAYVKKARASVLSSNYEGFPMSIIESLSIEIPVISVDCPSGPKEIIIDKMNGLLVEMNNKVALSNAFITFAFDEVVYQNCKSNAKKSIEHLSIEKISKQWEKLINTIYNEN